MKKGLILGLASAAMLAACSADTLGVPNPNSPTEAGAGSDPGVVGFVATGILRQLRGNMGGYITTTARFGREGYIYTPNEGRNTSHYLIGLSGANKLDPSGFAIGVWGGNYGNVRDIFNFKNIVASQPDVVLSPTQKSAAYGFAHTLEALELLYVIAGRDSLGGVTEIKLDPQDLAPFVTRDSMYNFILNTLDAADTELAAGGAAFPFTIHSGFTGFTTPTTFRQFNRAIAARAAVYAARKCLNGVCTVNAAMYTRAQTALLASFLNRIPANAAAMNVGAYHVYSTATGDATNGVGGNADFLTHPSYATDIVAGDARVAKWSILAVPRNAPQGLGIPTNLRMNRYANSSASVPIIRNEELLLLDAEVRWFTGADKAGAITDLTFVRSVSGGAGIGAPGATAASTDPVFTDALMYERRFSLMAEGHRWVDHRRFGRLNQLPLDITTGVNAHFRAIVMPVPQAECLVRARSGDAALSAPGC